MADKDPFTQYEVSEADRDCQALIRKSCADAARIIKDVVPEGKYLALALTRLEDVELWASKGIMMK